MLSFHLLFSLVMTSLFSNVSLAQEATAAGKTSLLEQLDGALTHIVQTTRPAVVCIEGRTGDIFVNIPVIPKSGQNLKSPRTRKEKSAEKSTDTEAPKRSEATEELRLRSLEDIEERVRVATGTPTVGTGFLLQGGFVVTTAEVVQGLRNPTVVMMDNKRITADWVNADSATNIAVIKVSGIDPKLGLKWGDSGKIAPGSISLMMGNQAGYPNSVALGLISGTGRSGRSGSQRYNNLIQFQGAVGQGGSGGPLLNARGEVIGLIVATPAVQNLPRYLAPAPTGKRVQFNVETPAVPDAPDAPEPPEASADKGNSAVFGFTMPAIFPIAGVANTGFALPASDIQPVIETLCKREKTAFQPGWLGVRLIDSSDNQDGATIESLFEGSPAHKSGLRPEDRIIAVNGKVIHSSLEIRSHLRRLGAGEVLKIDVMRGAERLSFSVKIEAKPDDEAMKKMKLRGVPMQTWYTPQNGLRLWVPV